MDLIPISDNTLINPDQIEAIEMRKVKGEKTFVIIIGGKSYIPDVDSAQLLKDLVLGGLRLNEQFFAV